MFLAEIPQGPTGKLPRIGLAEKLGLDQSLVAQLLDEGAIPDNAAPRPTNLYGASKAFGEAIAATYSAQGLSGIAIRMKEATWIGRASYKWAIGLGLKVADAELDGRRPGPFLKLGHAIADWLVLDNIKRAIGLHRVKFAGTGAAPIAPDVQATLFGAMTPGGGPPPSSPRRGAGWRTDADRPGFAESTLNRNRRVRSGRRACRGRRSRPSGRARWPPRGPGGT